MYPVVVVALHPEVAAVGQVRVPDQALEVAPAQEVVLVLGQEVQQVALHLVVQLQIAME